jgi:5-methylcytosine-specific restriction endonuclease McrA
MKLSRRQKCPIHQSYTCLCHGEPRAEVYKSKWITVRPGVRKIRDEHSPTGWRWLLSKAERQKVILWNLNQNGCTCGICNEPITDMSDVVPDHREPKGMGGARADDGENGCNLQPAHSICNLKKGSQRIPKLELIPGGNHGNRSN